MFAVIPIPILSHLRRPYGAKPLTNQIGSLLIIVDSRWWFLIIPESFDAHWLFIIDDYLIIDYWLSMIIPESFDDHWLFIIDDCCTYYQ